MGVFTTPAKKIPELSDVSAGLVSALPLIPFSMLSEIIAFFRNFMTNEVELEAMVHIFWDKEFKQYQIVVPQQYVSKARIVSAIPLEDALDEARFIHYADIHSHNSMPAEFSMVDDEDERATRLYIVIGKLNRFFPEINCRMSNGGTFWHIKSSEVLEGISDEFPWQWTQYVFTEPQPVINPFEEMMHNAI